jgi:hypothetical protein
MIEPAGYDETLIFGPDDPGPEPDEQAWQGALMLAAMVNVWTARGRLRALDAYLAGRRWTTGDQIGRNPLGNLIPFAEFHRVVTDAALAVRFPYVPRGSESDAERSGGGRD